MVDLGKKYSIMNLSSISYYSIGISSYINHLVASKYSEICPFIMVAEFPRSGGNWIRDMLGDCLQLPVPRFSKLPITFSGLVHSHFPTPITKIPAVYIIRDGRDVFVSHYWKSVNGVISDNLNVRKSIISKHPSLKNVVNKSNINHSELMLSFYEEWKIRPMGSRLNWGKHVTRWLQSESSHLVVIKYEEMITDSFLTLSESVSKLTGTEINHDTIEFAIKRNSFEAKTGRTRGDVDNTSNKRSGVAGGWKKTFCPVLTEKFHQDFGEALKICNYL